LDASEGRNWPRHSTAVIAVRSENLTAADWNILTNIALSAKKRRHPTCSLAVQTQTWS